MTLASVIQNRQIKKKTSWDKLKENPERMAAYQTWRRDYNERRKQQKTGRLTSQQLRGEISVVNVRGKPNQVKSEQPLSMDLKKMIPIVFALNNGDLWGLSVLINQFLESDKK